MATQRIAPGFPFPVYINETDSNSRVAPGVYVNETSGGAAVVNPLKNSFANPVLSTVALVAIIVAGSQSSPVSLLTTPAVAAPFSQTSWPNPAQKPSSFQAVTSQKLGTPSGYLSSDPPFAQRNWPNPVLSPYSFHRATSQPLGRLAALLPVFIQPPLNQYDWPNPVLRLKRFDTQPLGSPLILATLNGKGIKPFAQTQWPNPRGAYFFAIPLIVYPPAIFRSSGAPASPWTPVPPVTETWTPQTASSDIWTPQVAGVKSWTPQ